MERVAESPTPEEARVALASIEESKSRLANYVKSPWWLYPTQGIGVAAFIVGFAVSKHDIAFGTTALAASIVLFCILPLLQQTPNRVVYDVYTHRGSRGLALIYALLVGALAVAAVVVLSTAGPDLAWVAYVAAAAAMLLTVVIGPMMDARLKRAILADPR